MRYLVRLVLVAQLASAGCAHLSTNDADVMSRPIEFESSSQFYRSLQALEGELSASDYQRLTDAIGYLQAHDLENLDYEDFHDSLSGLSPNQIIQKAEGLGEQ